ncbi:hypothetical protein [Prochlorothrix hollandica]|uniref:hypothetical protein n=1 Tax=Prochlorothrix hollandica TaxID=1223 RepID=UPI000349487C|nr:hypothetical protein [Prochlorothrix hollandica]
MTESTLKQIETVLEQLPPTALDQSSGSTSVGPRSRRSPRSAPSAYSFDLSRPRPPVVPEPPIAPEPMATASSNPSFQILNRSPDSRPSGPRQIQMPQVPPRSTPRRSPQPLSITDSALQDFPTTEFADLATLPNPTEGDRPAVTSSQPTPSPVTPGIAADVAPDPAPRSVGQPYTTITIQPFAVSADPLKEPSLPKVKQANISQHRHSSNPSFAMGLLQDIALVVQQWQLELEEVHGQIQAIYMEGPIVDGWLEADTTAEGDVQRYRLCGLNQNGQVWSRPCAPDQLPGLSVAIARYQTLRQTMAHKHRLEVRLKQLGETLAVLRSRL